MSSAQQGEGFPVFHTFTALECRLTEVFRRMWLIPGVRLRARSLFVWFHDRHGAVAGLVRMRHHRPVVNASSLRLVLLQKEARFAGADDVHVAIAIHVAYYDLQTAAGLAAIGDGVAGPFDAATRHALEFVPIETQRVLVARSGGIAGHVTLASDEIRLSVAIHVGEYRRVGVRPGIVDDMLEAGAVGALLEPTESVTVRARGEDVVPAVAVDVEDVKKSPFGDAAALRSGAGWPTEVDHHGHGRRDGR